MHITTRALYEGGRPDPGHRYCEIAAKFEVETARWQVWVSEGVMDADLAARKLIGPEVRFHTTEKEACADLDRIFQQRLSLGWIPPSVWPQ